MRYKLYKEVIPKYSALQQILYNRGIPEVEQDKWLNAGWDQIYDWTDLAAEKMEKACQVLYNCINENLDVQILIDCDCDGYTSSAIIMNYFYDRFEDWSVNHLSYIMHAGKEHGLSDVMDQIDCDVIICPDASTNDLKEHLELDSKEITCICLDHHEVENSETIKEDPAIIINVQLEDYPNKALTGAGVAYKFISAFEDLIIHGNQPTELMDLCALGNIGDMGNYKELEIRGIVNIGLSNIRNPFFFSMAKKNDYSIQKMNGINYYSVAFYVVPFINAVVRSGTPEEKDIVFKSMLNQYAFDDVESSKRGHKGELIPLYEEAITVAERVKRRQTKLQDETVELFEQKIKEENLLDNSILIFLCNPGEVEKNIAGLIANKEQAKYQKPCLVLTKTKTVNDDQYYYRGSARNYGLSEKDDLKKEIENTGYAEYVAGHANAFGTSIAEKDIPAFIEKFNEQYAGIDQTPTYWVDYIWNRNEIDNSKILDIGNFTIYGQEIPESLVVIEDISIDSTMITLMSRDKNPTLKIQIGDLAVIKFKSSEEEYEDFCGENKVFTAVCKCNVNEWNGNISPQLIVEDFDLREEWIF